MTRPEPVAIVGMACLMPKAHDLRTYWQNILAARDCISEVPADHSWSAADYLDPDGASRGDDKLYCERGGFLDKVPFDPLEWGLPPVSLEAVDTAQLLALIVAREALKDAGIDPDGSTWPRERTACVLGVTSTQELAVTLGSRLHGPIWKKCLLRAGIDEATADVVVDDIANHFPAWQEQSFPGLLANVVSGRIANRFDLGGANATVDAACASSFAALELAVAELQAGKADLAISGGSDTLNDVFMYTCFTKTPAMSRAKDARPFDAESDGILIAEGVAMFALKRLSDAERDGDRIYAVIRGIGASSDGRHKSIYAPTSRGQDKAIRRAWAQAEAPLDTVELVEAHGTGTKAGDLAELQGLKLAFGEQGDWRVAVGSVKSQIGHTKATAGAAGLMKAALALYHKTLPPTAKVTTPNPKAELPGSPIYLNTLSRPWVRAATHPRRAGVSAFGFGGSNFHVALEEHVGRPEPVATHPPEGSLVLLGGATREALLEKIRALSMSDAPTAAHAAREALAAFEGGAHVVGFIVTDDLTAATDAARARVLAGPGHSDGVAYGTPAHAPRVAVLFPGQGSQYPNMLRTLALRHPSVRQAFDRADTAFVTAGRQPLSRQVYPPPAFDVATARSQRDALTATQWAQPAIGAASKGALDLLGSLGVTPRAVAGHSYGELVALHAAGVFDEEALWKLSRVRGEAMADDGGDRGTMAAVMGPLDAIEAVLATVDGDVRLANRNHPEQGVISGPRDAVEDALEALAEAGLSGKPLQVSAAFHSPLVADARAPLAEALAEVAITPPTIPVWSCATARPYPDEPDAIRALLADQITAPVDFVGIVAGLVEDGVSVFVECGPRGVLGRLVAQCPGDAVVVSLDADTDTVDGDIQLKRALAMLAAAGVPLDMAPLLAEPLPSLPPEATSAATVWIGGANFRRESTKNPPKPIYPQRTTAEQPAQPAVAPRAAPAPTPAAPRAALVPNPAPIAETAMSSDTLSTLLASTRATLEAFQQAQERTARVHEQFLASQGQAAATFATLFQTHARLVETAAGLPPSPRAPTVHPAPVALQQVPVPSAPAAAAAATPTPAGPDLGHAFGGTVPAGYTLDQWSSSRPAVAAETALPPLMSVSDFDAGTVVTGVAPGAVVPAMGAIPDPAAVQAALFAAVSDKTGFPVDLLELSMDLESDLGVDSIKRVEVLSDVAERLPALGAVDDDRLAGLRTLGEIVDTLATATATAPRAVGRDDVQAALFASVASKTGFPADLLELAMDLESDLGVDSIKRVEVLSDVADRLPSLGGVDDDRLTGLRTLGQLVDALASAASGPAPSPVPAAGAPSPEPEAAPATGPRRQEVAAVAAPVCLRGVSVHKLLITADPGGLAGRLADALGALGVATEVIDPDWSNLDAIAAAVVDGVDGLVHLALVGADHDAAGRLKGGFVLARALGTARLFATVSGMGGRFARDGGASLAGAVHGLSKTVAREWPGARCLAIDVDPRNCDAARLAAELLGDRGVTEVGLTDAGACTLAAVEVALPAEPSAPVEPGALVVVSGGARGVTAAVVEEMAHRWRPSFLLLGRSALALDPEWAAGVENAGLQAARLATAKAAGERVTPRDLKRDVDAVLAAREVRDRLDRLEAMGCPSLYRAVDVRDADAVRDAVREAEAAFGPARGVVHGAGVIADKLLVEKTDAAFDLVWSVKVDGLDALIGAVDPSALALAACFGSVAGRYGNTGQVDYAMANEALTYRLLALQHASPARVKAFAWGPWAGGMVDPALARVLRDRGVALIDVDAGARAFCDELEAGGPTVEVVIGGPELPGALAGADDGSGEVVHRLGPGDHRFLSDHQIDGKAVLPAVMALEWMAQAAHRARPDLVFAGVRDFQVLKGVVVTEPTELTLTWRPTAPEGDAWRALELELLGAEHKLGGRTVHYRGIVDLGRVGRVAPAFPGSNGLGKGRWPYSVEEGYARFLFHGPGFQGITDIVGWSDHGMVARLRTSTPKTLGVPADAWQTDPVILDSALQMVALWVRETHGASALPAGIGSYRQFAPFRGEVTCHLEVAAKSPKAGEVDATFVDDEGHVVAELVGARYAANARLNAAFRGPTPEAK